MWKRDRPQIAIGAHGKIVMKFITLTEVVCQGGKAMTLKPPNCTVCLCENAALAAIIGLVFGGLAGFGWAFLREVWRTL